MSTPIVDNCGTPTNSTVNGLPAAPCGAGFDQALDNLLGFYPGDDGDMSTVLGEVAPGTMSSVQTRSIYGRGFFSKLKAVVAPVVKAVVKVVVQQVAPIVKAVVPTVVQNAVAKVATVVVNIATTVVNTAEKYLSGTFSKSLNIPINIAPPAAMLSSSPWGNQFKFYSYELGSSDPSYSAKDAAIEIISGDLIGDPNPNPGIELFCVNCGVTGNIQVIGSLSISALQGFYAGTIGMQGNLEAGLFVGINGFYEWQKEIDAKIISVGLPGLSIPDVVTIGPQLELGISATLTVDAIGQILVGTSYSWPSLSATLDVMNSKNSQRSGFSPTVNRQFDVYGDVTATASLGLPVTLSFGIDFFSGKWSKSVDLKDVPSLNAVAEFSVTGNLDTGGNSISINTNGCNGISWNVNLANEVDLDIGDHTSYTLWQWNGPTLAQGCIGRAVPSSNSSSSSSIHSSTSSASSTIASSASTTLSNQVSPSLSSTVLYISPLASSTTSSNTATPTPSMSSTVLYVSPLASSTTSSNTATSTPSMLSTVLYISTSKYPDTSSIISTTSSVVPPSTSSISSTTTVSAVGSTSTTSAAPSSTVTCSVKDGANYTDINGYVYKSQCHYDLPNDSLGSLQVATFEECIAQCFNQQDHGCIAVSWTPGTVGKNGTCNFKGDRQTLPSPVSDATYGYEVDNAVLVSAPLCSNLTCPTNDAQYCMSNGEIFKMSCEIAYYANQLGSFNLETLSGCIDACSSGWPGVCNGVTFFPAQYKPSSVSGFPSTNCYPFGEGEEPVSYAAAMGGVSALTLAARNQGHGLWKRQVEDKPALNRRQAPSDSTNITHVAVYDTTQTISLLAADDGNLYVDLYNSTASANATESQFGSYGQTIIGDSQDRLLHYYPDSIAATGASRIRLAPWGSIPQTAALISLAPVSSGSQTIFIAVDTLGKYYWPYVCAIENQQNKVFLVDDATNGAGILQDPGLKFTVTGGVVNDCALLALTTSDFNSLS